MPRHKNREQATHALKAEREGTIECSADGDCPGDSTCGEDGVCVDAYGTPKPGQSVVVDGEPVEYDSGGTSFIRGSTGERVRHSPRITGRGKLATMVEEGDVVTLTPLADSGGGPTIDDLAVVEVDANFGRRARVGQARIELESV